MRIRNHRLAFFFLLSSALFVLADESPIIPEKTTDEVIGSSETTNLDIQETIQETQPKDDTEEHDGIPPTAETAASIQQTVEEIVEQDEQATLEDIESDEEQLDLKQTSQEQQGDDGEDQENDEQIEEDQQISEENVSSLATDDTIVEDADLKDGTPDDTVENNESDDGVDASTDDLQDESDQSGSDSIEENVDDSGIEQINPTGLEEPEIIGDDGSDTEEEIIKTRKEPIVDTKEDDANHEILYDKGHIHLDKKDAEHDKLYKEGHTHIEIADTANEEVDQNQSDIESSETSVEKTAEAEEEIDVQDAKTIIGTTSTEPIVEDDSDDMSDESTENDGSTIEERTLEENKDTEIDETEYVQISVENITEDGLEETEEQEDIEKVEELKDDDDDEDLAQKISVDYASKSAGALIIEKTREFKGTSNLITGDRDRYAIVPCNEEKKSFVLSLSEDILVKEIKLANYERFSSTVKDFQIKGSHTLGKWVDLGIYRANSGMGEQSFVLETPAWARYLKFKFLTHHGNEWFCTLSQIKVHGSNMVQDFHEHWESIGEKEDQSDEAIEGSSSETVDNSGINNGNTDISKDENIEKNVSNSSTAGEVDPSLSAEEGDVARATKNDSGPRHAQVPPSVHSKPMPLDQFRNHMTFSDIIQVEMGEDNLLSDLYTIESLPAHVKNDLTCNDMCDDMRNAHQIGRLAMDSLYRFGTSVVDDFIPGKSSSSISSAKMDAFSNEFYQKRFGKEISSLAQLYANNIVYPTSPSYLGLPGESIDESNGGDATDEHSTRQLGEEGLGELKFSENIESLDVAIQKLIKDLPSAECLVHLDFTDFKNRISTMRKSAGASGGSQGGRMMEPIFKKLTDEIFALQTSLSVHDQFSKLSVGCYQRVILDLAVETEKLRQDQDERLRRLEEQILDPSIMRLIQKLIVSVASATASFLYSSGSYLFFTIKDVWIPKLLRYHLSKDSYETLHETYTTTVEHSTFVTNGLYLAFDYSSKGIKTLVSELNSKGWTNPETYQDYLSAWSTYYDGGMTVVFIVLTVLCLRVIMMLWWLFRPKNRDQHSVRAIRNGRIYYKEAEYAKKHKKKSSKSKRRPKDPPVAENAAKETTEILAPIAGSTIQETPVSPIAENTIQETTMARLEAETSETSAPVVDTTTAHTNAQVVEDNTSKASVPIVEDNNDVKPAEEAIPELKEEIVTESTPSLSPPKNNMTDDERTNRTTATSPSVISLEEH